MQPRSLIFVFAPCGWGCDGGLFPSIRFGVVSVAWCRGSLLEKLRGYERSLSAALAKLRTGKAKETIEDVARRVGGSVDG